jgi:alkylation response protein AidB-like acyl-CoA dehydrogenase
VAVAAAETVLSALGDLDGGDPMPLILARLQAGEAAAEAARQAQQVLGGIGFSWEHALHRYVRRARCLEVPTGSTRETLARLGHHLADVGSCPLVGHI